MPLTNPSYQCRRCLEFHTQHEIRGNAVGKRGICFQCLYAEYNDALRTIARLSREIKQLTNNHAKGTRKPR